VQEAGREFIGNFIERFETDGFLAENDSGFLRKPFGCIP
jgi:hypothetical protein